MSALQEISALLGQWRQHSEAETLAIQHAAWQALHQIQEVKSGLQESISAAFDRWAEENYQDGTPWSRADHPFGAEVNRLVSLEERNGRLLAAQFHARRDQKKSQDDALRNLRRVHRSYGRKHEACWQSYS